MQQFTASLGEELISGRSMNRISAECRKMIGD
jgi:hypothetical protein